MISVFLTHLIQHQLGAMKTSVIAGCFFVTSVFGVISEAWKSEVVRLDTGRGWRQAFCHGPIVFPTLLPVSGHRVAGSGSEPGAAFGAAVAHTRGSDDMVTEIATHEEFWWDGPARPSPEFYMALAAEHASPSPNQLPPNSSALIASANVTKSVVISQAPSRYSALAIPAHFACPEPPIRNLRTLAFSSPQHRNTSLGHRASVLLLI